MIIDIDEAAQSIDVDRFDTLNELIMRQREYFIFSSLWTAWMIVFQCEPLTNVNRGKILRHNIVFASQFLTQIVHCVLETSTFIMLSDYYDHNLYGSLSEL